MQSLSVWSQQCVVNFIINKLCFIVFFNGQKLFLSKMATLLSYKSWKGKKGGKEVKSAVSKLGKILLHSTVPKVPLTKS